MRTRLSFVSFLFILAPVAAWLAPPAGTAQSAEPAPRVSQLARLLDAGTIVFGSFANFSGIGNAPIDAMTHSIDETFDVVMYDLEHNPFDVEDMRTYMQFLLDPGALTKTGDLSVSKTVIARVPGLRARTRIQHLAGQERARRRRPRRGLPPHRDGRAGADRGERNALPAGAGSARRRAHRHPRAPARRWRRATGASSVPEYREQSDIWRLDPNGNLIPWFIIENRLAVANVRDIARALAERNIGAVLWAGTGDLGVSLHQDQEALAEAVDEILAAGKEFGLPVAMNGAADVARRIEQGARIFMGAATAEARREAGR